MGRRGRGKEIKRYEERVRSGQRAREREWGEKVQGKKTVAKQTKATALLISS